MKHVYVKIVSEYVPAYINVMTASMTHKKDISTLRIRKSIIKNETESTEIAPFGSVTEKVMNNTCYDFRKIRVQKFMYDCILKLTETITVAKRVVLIFL